MSKVFRITPKRTKRVNGQVITPEIGDYSNNPPALSQPVLQRGG